MIIMSLIVISVITIVASAVVSAYVNISRERLWLRAMKAEEIYASIENVHTSMTTKIAAALNLPQSSFISAGDLEGVFQKLSMVKVSVRLYFPEAGRELSCVEGAAKSLGAALADLSDRGRGGDYNEALSSFDSSLCNFAESLSLLKNRILSEAVIQENWFGFLLRRSPESRVTSRTYVGLQSAAF